MAAMPEVKQANSVIEDMKNMITKKGQDMVQTLQAKYQTLQIKATKWRVGTCGNRKTSRCPQGRRRKHHEV